MEEGKNGLKAVKGVRLYESVLESLRDYIESGQIQVGETFPSERTMEAQLHVSRPVLREAFRVLESAGVVRSRPGGRRHLITSALPDSDTLRSARLKNNAETLLLLWEAREPLECRSASLAARRRTEEQLQEIQRPIAMIGNLTRQIYRETDSNLEFHLAIAKASANPFLEQSIRHLIEQFRSLDFKHLLPPDNWDDLQGTHRSIFNAIQNQDSKLAERAMRAHFVQLRASIKNER